MLEQVKKLLNKKQKKVDKALEDMPFPLDGCLQQRKFSYNLGQSDLILELRSNLGLEINNKNGEEETIN